MVEKSSMNRLSVISRVRSSGAKPDRWRQPITSSRNLGSSTCTADAFTAT